MDSLKDKKVIITGSTGGIGSAITEIFVKYGANVLATGTNDEKLNNLKKKFQNINTRKFDISCHKEIEKFVEDCSKT